MIDAHMHLGQHIPSESVVGLLQEAGLDGAAVMADPESSDILGDNLYVLEQADDYPFYPFYYIGGNAYSTNRPVPRFEDFDLSNLKEYCGVKWHCYISPSHDAGFFGLSLGGRPRVEEMDTDGFHMVMEAIREAGIPINFEEHFGITVEFVKRYPDIPIIIPHMGAMSGGSSKILREFKDAPNVYFDTSISGVNERIVHMLGSDRILMGSDFPYGHPSWPVEEVKALSIPDEDKELIASGNFLRLIGEKE